MSRETELRPRAAPKARVWDSDRRPRASARVAARVRHSRTRASRARPPRVARSTPRHERARASGPSRRSPFARRERASNHQISGRVDSSLGFPSRRSFSPRSRVGSGSASLSANLDAIDRARGASGARC
eukprot:31398-Pelagococcus_subviridis.AAC.16